MIEVKNTQRSHVSMTYDGRFIKRFAGPLAADRYRNEASVLQYLEDRCCPFVPRLLEQDFDRLTLVVSSCGVPAVRLSNERVQALFRELESYGVRHDDEHLRNVTYRAEDGRFCLIDFEFARILGPTLTETMDDRIDEISQWIATELGYDHSQECR